MQPSANPPATLVVEDDLVILSFLTTFLTRHGYHVVACESLACASRALADETAFVSAFIDGHLGGSTVDEMLAFIRDLAPRVRGPIVAMSSDEAIRAEQLRAGCTHAAQKSDIVRLLEKPEFALH